MTTVTHKVVLHRLGISSTKDTKACSTTPLNYHGTTILACSSFSRDRDSVERILRASDNGRLLLSDKKAPFEQFLPKRLILSTIRVMAAQAATTMSYFVTDQMEAEIKREKLVKDGRLSPDEADRQNEEWEDREWSLRWSNFGEKCIQGILKYQATTLVMRFYEYALTKRGVNDGTMDKLTKDPFKASKRTADVVGGDSMEMVRPMFETCLWSNAIAFLADYTVHQIILAFTYYMYCREKRRRRLQEREEEQVDEDESEEGPMAMTFALKSSRLFVTRGLGLLSASVGGAVGSYMYPGWGTVIGINLGDSFMATALEERTA